MDATRLYVAPTGATNPLDQKYDIFDTSGNRRVNLFGFSFFGELAGLPADAEGYGLDLLASGDHAVSKPGRFSMTFDNYFATLKLYKVNFIRVFLFNSYPVRVQPFKPSTTDPGKFDLTHVSPGFLLRIDEFIRKAKDHGIVVCLSLSSAQAIAEPKRDHNGKIIEYNFRANPFFVENNANGLIVDANGSGVEKAFPYYCTIVQPSDPSVYRENWTQPEKLWWIQKNLFTKIVEATRVHWNVMYELFNEPRLQIANAENWHRMVGKWLHDELWDAAANRRSRLVTITAGDDLIDGGTFIQHMVNEKLADAISFHGGAGNLPSQWGGYHGGGPGVLCGSTPERPVGEIVNGSDVNNVHHRGIADAMRRFKNFPLALIFDTDSQYLAQKYPTHYAEEVLNVDGSFDYRWSDTYLIEVNDTGNPCTPLQNPPLLGLGQRLNKLRPRNASRITVF